MEIHWFYYFFCKIDYYIYNLFYLKMATLKLLIDEIEENNYTLIAMHSVLEDYRLAFFLNKELPIILTKSPEKFSITNKKGNAVFQKFVYIDVYNGFTWTLIQNKIEITNTEKSTANSLFFNEEIETETKIFLLPEFKKVDYFLKIDHPENNFDVQETLEKINKIYNLSTVYVVENEHIKSKNNLIF